VVLRACASKSSLLFGVVEFCESAHGFLYAAAESSVVGNSALSTTARVQPATQTPQCRQAGEKCGFIKRPYGTLPLGSPIMCRGSVGGMSCVPGQTRVRDSRNNVDYPYIPFDGPPCCSGNFSYVQRPTDSTPSLGCTWDNIDLVCE